MAWSFSMTTPATAPVALYTLLGLLLAQGWTKTKDSDGTTYSSAGTRITSGASGTNGLDNNRAWFVIKAPGSNRSLCFQRDTADSNVWRISYCADNAFTGGSPSATQIPAPGGSSVEIILLGGGTPASPTFASEFTAAAGSYKWFCVVGGSAEGYSFAAWAANTAAGHLCSAAMFMDAMRPGSYPSSDPDPYVLCMAGSAAPDFSGSVNNDTGNAKAFLGALTSAGNNYKLGQRTYQFGNVNNGTNPFSSKDSLSLVPWLRTSAPSALKGFSTLFQFTSVTDRENVALYSVASTGDHIYVTNFSAPMVLPWNNTDPGYSAGTFNAEILGQITGVSPTQTRYKLQSSTTDAPGYVSWTSLIPDATDRPACTSPGPVTIIDQWQVPL